MNFEWIPERKINKCINQLNFHRNIQVGCKITSPTIKLLKDTRKVQKTKQLYENELIFKSCDGSVNQWVFDSSLMEFYISNDEKEKILKRFKQDLIKYEKEHLKNLEIFEGEFRKMVAKTSGYMSMMIRKLHISLSGSVSEIIDLHKYKILPVIQTSSFNWIHILSYIMNLIESDQFYCYVTHAMLYHSTLHWLDNYSFILNSIFIKSGVDCSKLDIDDIIRLYKDLTSDVYEQLIDSHREYADEIELCKSVENKLNHLLDLIADAKKIACIKEVSKNNIESIEKLYQIMENHLKEEISYPTLILFPRYDCHYGYRNPIDLLKLGQFVRIWNENSMLSKTAKCYYDTNLFIFERCIIYTVIINENRFVYNGHFWIKDCQFESILKNGKPCVLAVLCSGDRQLILDNVNFVSAIMRLHDLHKDEEIEAEIEIPFKAHVKILSKIDNCNLRRLSLTPSN